MQKLKTAVRKLLLKLPRPFGRTCVDCGFLTPHPANDAEAKPPLREALALQAFTPDERMIVEVLCSRDMWGYEFAQVYDFLSDDQAQSEQLWGLIHREATGVPRWRCKGFHPHSPGRSPKEHLKLQDERRLNRHQLRLAAVSFFGALFGVLLAAVLQWLFGE